jgi:hypothetical protein
MPPKHPPWLEKHGNGLRALHPPYAYSVPSTKQPRQRRCDNTPLTCLEQATIDTRFACKKHYFLPMQNIERACFTTLDTSVNDGFKVSNNPTIQGRHTGLRVMDILNQLSMIYGQPTPAILEMNDANFCSPYSAMDAPKVLFRHIEECTKKVHLGRNLYTDRQLATNTIRLLLTTGLYIRPLKEWDCLTPVGQRWIVLHTMIQEAFQHRLNMTAPTAGHHGYAPVLPHQQNAFRMLCATCVDSDKKSVNTVATQVAAWTYQSQLTAMTAANSSQRAELQLAHLSSQNNLMHENMHQIIAQVNALSFNQSNSRQGHPMGSGNGGSKSNCGQCTRGVAPLVLVGASFMCTADLTQLLADFPQALPWGLCLM